MESPEAVGPYRNRIKRLDWIAAKLIDGAPWNWRDHPDNQRSAVVGSLEELGIYDAQLVREVGDRFELIDGHLREDIYSQIGPETLIPCIVTDLTEEEARKANATHDPLAALAESNADKLAELMHTLDVQSDDLRKMLDNLAGQAGLLDPPEKGPVEEPEILEIYQVVLTCKGEDHQRELYERFKAEGLEVKLVTI